MIKPTPPVSTEPGQLQNRGNSTDHFASSKLPTYVSTQDIKQVSNQRRVVAILQGGLGNQLFQYCAAHTFAALTSVEEPLLFRKYGKWHTGLAIDEMLPEVSITERPPHIPLGLGNNRYLAHVINALRHRTGEVKTFMPESAFSPIPKTLVEEFKNTKNRMIILDGYFQHKTWYEKILNQVADQIVDARRNQFIQAQSALPTGTLAVTIRSTDYIALGWGLEWNYYEKGLKHFRDQGWNGPVTVMADDESTRLTTRTKIENLGFQTIEIPLITEDATLNDFLTIAAAPYRLIANSTFAWWAAVSGERLTRNPGSIVGIPDPYQEIDKISFDEECSIDCVAIATQGDAGLFTFFAATDLPLCALSGEWSVDVFPSSPISLIRARKGLRGGYDLTFNDLSRGLDDWLEHLLV